MILPAVSFLHKSPNLLPCGPARRSVWCHTLFFHLMFWLKLLSRFAKFLHHPIHFPESPIHVARLSRNVSLFPADFSETCPPVTGLRTSCFCGYNTLLLCWCKSLSIIIGIINKYPNPLLTCESLKDKSPLLWIIVSLSECFCTKRVHCVGNTVWWRREAASFGIQTTWMWTKALPLSLCACRKVI